MWVETGAAYYLISFERGVGGRVVGPEGLLQPVFWQLVPEEALHLPAGAGPRVELGMGGYQGGRRGAQTCRTHTKLYFALHAQMQPKEKLACCCGYCAVKPCRLPATFSAASTNLMADKPVCL